jgi:uncharacterized membrane protein
MRNKPMQALPYVMLVLALAGIADAGYDSYAIYTGQALWCPPPIDGCNTVANSPYARVFGVPLGYLGVVYYVGMAAVATMLASAPWSRAPSVIAAAYATSGVLASAAFFYLQLNYIHAFCIYCAMSAILTVLLCAASWMHYRRARTEIATRDLQPA